MGQLIAIDPDALAALVTAIDRIDQRLSKIEMTPRKEWLNLPDAAAELDRDVSTVRRWIRDGTIDSKEIAGVKMVRLP